MLVLFESPAGYSLFKVLDEGKLKDVSTLSDVSSLKKVVSLKQFSKFDDTTEALAAATALVESKLSPGLSSFLTENISGKSKKEALAVADKFLGNAIKSELGIKVAKVNSAQELFRGIRANFTSLVDELHDEGLQAMTLGLSHSLSRYKLKFSPDKVDVMIVQAIGLLDDIDKELNTYAMRVREWYGWHFPEMSAVIPDNIVYAKLVKLIGLRKNILNVDLTDIVTEEIQEQVRHAAQISMGTEVSEEDIFNVTELCDQVIEIHEYREELFSYLKNRMQAIAPNLTIIVGELVGARLIAHAGSLMNLAKQPASTVQILGAEKALFRAIKAKHETPKYGLIFHASLVGQSSQKHKGKISRILAAKASLAIRYDALGEKSDTSIGIAGKEKIEQRLRQLGDGKVIQSNTAIPAYDYKKSDSNPGLAREASQYNPAADSTLGSEKKKRKREPETEDAAAEQENGSRKKKKKKRSSSSSSSKSSSKSSKSSGKSKKSKSSSSGEKSKKKRRKKSHE